MKGIGKTVKRRRLQSKTDYKSRFGILKSGKPRIIIRKTNRYILVQFVSTTVAQDKVLFGVSSQDLLSEGWPEQKSGSLKSRGAAYLTGLLLARKAVSEGTKEAIIDLGMHRNIKGSRMYAVVKGLIDGGVNVPAGSEALPTEAQLEANANTREIVIKLKEKLKTNGGKGNKK
jgi:large subunit ribosomal protein L18